MTFGSLAILESKDLVEIAWGLVQSKQPFLWVIRPGLIKRIEMDRRFACKFLRKCWKKGLNSEMGTQRKALSHFVVVHFGAIIDGTQYWRVLAKVFQ